MIGIRDRNRTSTWANCLISNIDVIIIYVKKWVGKRCCMCVAGNVSWDCRVITANVIPFIANRCSANHNNNNNNSTTINKYLLLKVIATKSSGRGKFYPKWTWSRSWCGTRSAIDWARRRAPLVAALCPTVISPVTCSTNVNGNGNT